MDSSRVLKKAHGGGSRGERALDALDAGALGPGHTIRKPCSFGGLCPGRASRRPQPAPLGCRRIALFSAPC